MIRSHFETSLRGMRAVFFGVPVTDASSPGESGEQADRRSPPGRARAAGLRRPSPMSRRWSPCFGSCSRPRMTMREVADGRAEAPPREVFGQATR